VITDKDAVVTR